MTSVRAESKKSDSDREQKYPVSLQLPDVSGDSKALGTIQEILHPSPIEIDIKPVFLCPITQSLMCDPVATEDGQTYEREAIENWLETKNTSPMTNTVLKSKKLSPGLFARGQIGELLDNNTMLRDSKELYLPKNWIKELDEACRRGDEKAIQNLGSRDRRLLVHTFSEEPYQGKTAVHLAAAGHLNSLGIVINLLERRTTGLALQALLQPDSKGQLPIHEAVAANQSVDTLRKLVEWMGVTHASRPNRNGDTVLHLAVRAGNTEAVVALLELGISPDITNTDGQTARELAVLHGKNSIVKQHDKTVTKRREKTEYESQGAIGLLLLKQQQVIEKQKEQLEALQVEMEVFKKQSKEQRTQIEVLQVQLESQQESIKDQQKNIEKLRSEEVKPLAVWKNSIFTNKNETILKGVLKQKEDEENVKKIEAKEKAKTQEEAQKLLPLQNKLVDACEDGDLKGVKAALASGAKLCYPSTAGKQPLGAAVWGMNPEVVQYLTSKMEAKDIMSWNEIKKHNYEHYRRTWLINKFEPDDFPVWSTTLEEIEYSSFMQVLHQQEAHKVMNDSSASSSWALWKIRMANAAKDSSATLALRSPSDPWRRTIAGTEARLQDCRQKITATIEQALDLHQESSASSSPSTFQRTGR